MGPPKLMRVQARSFYVDAKVQSRCQLINVFGAGADASSSNWTDLSCQRVKLVGKRQFAAALQQELALADHGHEFDAGQDISGGPK